MDANSGAPWSEMDIADLTHSLDYGDTFAQKYSTMSGSMRSLSATFGLADGGLRPG